MSTALKRLPEPPPEPDRLSPIDAARLRLAGEVAHLLTTFAAATQRAINCEAAVAPLDGDEAPWRPCLYVGFGEGGTGHLLLGPEDLDQLAETAGALLVHVAREQGPETCAHWQRMFGIVGGAS